MEFKKFLKAEKTVIDQGKWITGKPHKKLLELSKGKLSIGSQWIVRKIEIKIKEQCFQIIICIHEAKENYVAHLASKIGNDNLVIASLENHGTHPGWHLHVNCDGSGGYNNIGRIHYPSQRRIPHGKGFHRKRSLPIKQSAGLEAVTTFFHIKFDIDPKTLPLW